jgi:hypothetical protein
MKMQTSRHAMNEKKLLARPWARRKDARRKKTKAGGPRHCHATSQRLANCDKGKLIMDSLSQFDPNAVHSPAAVARWSGAVHVSYSTGGACALAIPDRVTSARLRPRFRHGRGRNRFVRWQLIPGTQTNTPTAALQPLATVVQHFWGKDKEHAQSKDKFNLAHQSHKDNHSS